MDQSKRIAYKAMLDWVKENGTQPVPKDYINRFVEKKAKDGLFLQTWGLLPKETPITKEDIEEEVELLSKDESINNNHTEDYENMQDFENNLIKSNKSNYDG